MAVSRSRAASRTSRTLLFNGGVILEPVPGIRAYGSYAEGFTVPGHRPHHPRDQQ